MRYHPLNILFGFLFLVGCSSAPIDGAVTFTKKTATYTSFSVTTENIPAFLGPIITSNFDVAMASKGLQPTDHSGNPDLNITLRYEQIDLGTGAKKVEGDEQITMDDSLKFVARIAIEARVTGEADIIWSGYVQKIHDVAPGEWMHTGNASVAFLDAFNKVLADF